LCPLSPQGDVEQQINKLADDCLGILQKYIEMPWLTSNNSGDLQTNMVFHRSFPLPFVRGALDAHLG